MSPFDNLKGIQKEREVKDRKKTNLEYLLEAEKVIVEKYSKGITKFDVGALSEKICPVLNKEVKKNLEYINFNKEDIKDLIFAKVNNDYNVYETQVLGAYTGCLLNLLTERNQKDGKRTKLYINGHGNRFDYLFFRTTNIDELIINNFVGDWIGSHAGETGKINFLCGLNIDGDQTFLYAGNDCKTNFIGGINLKGNNILSTIGVSNSNINFVFGINIRGYRSLAEIKQAKLIVGANIFGDESLCWTGSSKGKVGMAVGINLEGEKAFIYSGNVEGYVNRIILINSENNYAAQFLGSGHQQGSTELKGKVKQLVLYNVTGDKILLLLRLRILLEGKKLQKNIQKF